MLFEKLLSNITFNDILITSHGSLVGILDISKFARSSLNETFLVSELASRTLNYLLSCRLIICSTWKSCHRSLYFDMLYINRIFTHVLYVMSMLALQVSLCWYLFRLVDGELLFINVVWDGHYKWIWLDGLHWVSLFNCLDIALWKTYVGLIQSDNAITKSSFFDISHYHQEMTYYKIMLLSGDTPLRYILAQHR